MKKVISLIIIFITIISLTTVSLAVVRAGGRVSGSRVSSSVKSTSSSAKSSTGQKSTTPKYNSSNIKTEKINDNPTYYKNYSSTNIFTPNFWMAMWAFQCTHNNTKQVSEQDIAKELEERGYTQEEIKEILAEGKSSQEIAMCIVLAGVGAVKSIK